MSSTPVLSPADKRRKIIDTLKTRTVCTFVREVRKTKHRKMTREEFLDIFAKDLPASCHEELWGTFLYDFMGTADPSTTIELESDTEYDDNDLPLQEIVDAIENDIEEISDGITTCVITGKPAGNGMKLIDTKIGPVLEDIAQYLPQIEAALMKK